MKTGLTQKEIHDLLDDGSSVGINQSIVTESEQGAEEKLPQDQSLPAREYPGNKQSHNHNSRTDKFLDKVKEYPKETIAKAFMRLGAKQRQSILVVLAQEDMEYFTAALNYENLQEMIQLILSMKTEPEQKTTEDAFQELVEILEETDNKMMLEKKRELLIGLCNSVQEERILRSIIDQFEQSDPVLAERLKSILVSEAVLLETDDRGIQRWLREVDHANLAVFLKYCDNRLKDKIMSNLSTRLGEMLREDITYLGQYNQESIKKTKHRLFAIYRMLVEAGEIMHPFAML